MGLISFSIAGIGFTSIGTWQVLTSLNATPSDQINKTHKKGHSFFVTTSIFSLLFIINSIYSCFEAVNARDQVGLVLQLQTLAVVSLFFFYSILSLISFHYLKSFTLSPLILEFVLLFAFILEFLLYYLQKKDTTGIENRYFDLLLVPITICVFTTILELKFENPGLSFAKVARGLGLILQGTWFWQMGISFYSSLIVHGCTLHEKSRGNYTVRCKGHGEYHRGRAIATLQFNCHLALFVTLSVVLYSIMAKRNGYRGDFANYRPLVSEIGTPPFENVGSFTLDSDSDDGIKDESNVGMKKAAMVELTANGHGSHE
ncbi:hypothetical protein ACFE04_007211 [Oxalis oulophora]